MEVLAPTGSLFGRTGKRIQRRRRGSAAPARREPPLDLRCALGRLIDGWARTCVAGGLRRNFFAGPLSGGRKGPENVAAV